MGRIQSNIGLITGLPIGDTVDQLMQISGRPRDMLVTRTNDLQSQRVAITELSAFLASLQFSTTNLGKTDLYTQRVATSSNSDALTATITGDPPLGVSTFTPVRPVQHQQFLSSGVKTDTDPIGAGQLTFRFGASVERTTDLSLLGGGEGVNRGSIQITDRSGASATVDLSLALTVDDVLEAINGEGGLNVTASAVGDRIRLTDHTGSTNSNLRVGEVGGGTTAASLGLDGIDVAADVANGSDVLSLADDIDLEFLNDGNGIGVNRALDDIQYELRDGTTGSIDLSPIVAGSSEVDAETTLGEILEAINAAEPGKLQIEIAPDGDRLLVTDLTAGAGTFSLAGLNDSSALTDLGLDAAAAGGQITGRRLLGGMQSVLLSSLDGGQGLGQLGDLSLTDRFGANAIVDLSAAETLDEVTDLINSAGVGIVAQANPSGNGLKLTDTTGVAVSNLIVASADASGTAEILGLAVDDAITSVNSGDLHLQTVGANSRLSDLNGGAGVARGKLTVYDSDGKFDELSLLDSDIETIDDVIRAINRLNVDVLAELNETGDGIRIRDLADGDQTMKVEEGNTTTAADLHLLGGMVEVDIEGQPTQVIDGSSTYTVTVDDNDTIEDLRDKINDLGAGVSASIFHDGSFQPYRLSIRSDQSGKAGEVVLDTSQLDLSLQETASAKDALLVLGDVANPAANVLLSSRSNTFQNVVDGVDLELKQASTTPVSITVTSGSTNLVAGAMSLVDNYNRFRERLDTLTQYDSQTNEGSLLTGDSNALRLDTELSRFVSGRFGGAGSIKSLREVGIRLKSDGKLELDESTLKAKFAEDPQAVEEFFTKEDVGLSDKFDAIIESLAGEENSLLSERINALADKIDNNQQRVTFLNSRLDKQRERLLMNFYRMELAIGKLQSNLQALQTLNPIPPMSSSSSS